MVIVDYHKLEVGGHFPWQSTEDDFARRRSWAEAGDSRGQRLARLQLAQRDEPHTFDLAAAEAQATLALEIHDHEPFLGLKGAKVRRHLEGLPSAVHLTEPITALDLAHVGWRSVKELSFGFDLPDEAWRSPQLARFERLAINGGYAHRLVEGLEASNTLDQAAVTAIEGFGFGHDEASWRSLERLPALRSLEATHFGSVPPPASLFERLDRVGGHLKAHLPIFRDSPVTRIGWEAESMRFEAIREPGKLVHALEAFPFGQGSLATWTGRVTWKQKDDEGPWKNAFGLFETVPKQVESITLVERFGVLFGGRYVKATDRKKLVEHVAALAEKRGVPLKLALAELPKKSKKTTKSA